MKIALFEITDDYNPPPKKAAIYRGSTLIFGF